MAADSGTYRVRPGDELWDIAGTHLHDPLQWRAIWDLNKGHVMVDADGREEIFDNPRIIMPGWTLLLPTGTTVAPTASGGDPPVTGPAAGAPAPAAAPAAAPTMTEVSAPPTAESPPTMVAMAAGHTSTSGIASATNVAEAGVLGAAVVSILHVLRRRQAQRRPSGRRIRLPGPSATRAELALRQSETPERVLLVERSMTGLADALRRHPDPPTIVAVVVDDTSVEALLDRPVPPPPSWTSTAGGFRWRIAAADVADDSMPTAPWLPALVSFGRAAAGDADVLVNLEAAGLLCVRGEADRTAGFLFCLATQLVGTRWAQALNLVLVALPPGLATRDNVRQVTSIREIEAELRATADIMESTARQRGCADLFQGRIRGDAGDGWPPVVVLCGTRPSAEELDILRSLSRPGLGVAAVVANAEGSTQWEVDVSSSPCPIQPLRLAVEPMVLGAETMAAIVELIGTAEQDSGAGLDVAPYERVDITVERPLSAESNGTMPAETTGTARAKLPRADQIPEVGHPEILVRVLGSVEIDGAHEFKRAKSRELVVYLAMHPNGVGEAELDEALWGSSTGRVVLSSTRDSTVSVARTALGGAARLLPAQGQGREKRYQLGPEVQSDWSQFCLLHRFGRDHQSTAALRGALELVRGRPFDGVISGRTYAWIHTEGHGRHIEAEVADAADLAAGLYLDSGDALAARWAARRGLLAEPYTERLWVRLMEAADALGESQEIERIMDEMDLILELDGDFSALHPNTLAVYDRLSRRRRYPAGT
ncbi:MAG TPA: hypothetical protein VHT75_17755 [Acidimicrobiales bacterium]|jgi:DNA-binding SARP family transcriptional activator|nr:hypothetical protein [Acidimicrobiales bacterium]